MAEYVDLCLGCGRLHAVRIVKSKLGDLRECPHMPDDEIVFMPPANQWIQQDEFLEKLKEGQEEWTKITNLGEGLDD